ncbi:MAG: hydroxymethylglutaryl-CoA lyase [Phycisphaerales bacterium]|jgi:hydroxymethylglutaryl-CoA lyase|nr:hydroxymethylglutaryl-CoA lyase [Phycisphaerales bacterium]
MTNWPKEIRITEVGPRDGLQNQAKQIPTQSKIELIDSLSQTGLTCLEVSSFVHPKWVPQLSDADEVFAGITRKDGVMYTALVPNEHGLQRAIAAKVDGIAVLTAASETFCERNTKTSIKESIDRIKPIVEDATSLGMSTRGYISCVIGCPYEGKTDFAVVRQIVQKMKNIGITDIALGETIGIAVPTDIRKLYEALDGELSPEESILHLHDTRGTALACVAEAMQCGCIQFDSSCGGIGGCPYAPGAAGNIATEDIVYFADRMGIKTGVDFESLVKASEVLEHNLDCQLISRAYRASQDPHTRPSE